MSTHPTPNETVPDPSRLRRWCWFLCGWFFVALATAGAVLPGLPTTPFLLLASYFFVRSSPRTHRWLLQSRLFGPFLRDWHHHRAVRRSVKYTAFAMIVVVLAISALSNRLPTLGLIAVTSLGLVGMTVVLLLPEIRATPPTTVEPSTDGPG